MSHVHYRNEAESNWDDADDATASEAAMFFAQMATYGALVTLIDDIEVLHGLLGTFARG